MRALSHVVVISGLLAAAAPASAIPIVYAFSGVYDPYAGQVEFLNYDSHPFQLPDLSSCADCPAFAGRLSYDSDLGVIELDLTSAITASTPVFDLGGVAATSVSDTSLLRVSYANRDLGDAFLADGGWIISSWSGYGTGLLLGAPDLISGGELRSGLTIADFTVARIYRPYGLVLAHLMRSNLDGSPCPVEQWLQCAQSGDYSLPKNPYTADFQILEIHQVPAPEPQGLTAFAALGLFVARMSRSRFLTRVQQARIRPQILRRDGRKTWVTASED